MPTCSTPCPPVERRSAPVRDVGWMVEELRVSLFANGLGTAYPVSEKRIRAAIAALGLSAATHSPAVVKAPTTGWSGPSSVGECQARCTFSWPSDDSDSCLTLRKPNVISEPTMIMTPATR